ncbi:TPA: CPBP family intramembrane metalloprotease [Streptococcus suis]|uniref:RevS (RevS) n=1 Tax=Streptococcus suis TaxID=1307 RepID=A0A0Z8MPG4_STRSU|nr:type II CAAX endopeptidase family protein [Streptococcus suis]NQG65236.1 CPBP family intramembrane metalloprotease [Streptococcus suis]NQG67152.1 CPBP family intramembrane metalloprotease [Streptococcus suis]CYV82287.1 RevS (revS) [Streptococcus suis]CYW12758.1 RevS (revS) [Streptococcus suis]HEM4881060.1 CPBP family intramembrane metalloprotease [Streptococcus suis]
MKIIKSIGLAVGTLLLTLLIQFPAYVGITAFQESILLKLAVMIGLGLPILALLSVIRRGMMKHQVFSREKLNVLKIVGMTALVFTGQTCLNLFWQYLGLSLSDSNAMDTVNQLNSDNFGVMALSVVLFAPVLEEFLYRGILLEKTAQYFPKHPQMVIVFSALLFAYCHTWNFSVAFLGHFITGAYLGYLYMCNRRMTDTILSHSFYNASILFLQILFGLVQIGG